ncbi:CsbD family protein [Microvirga sp. M2]
MDRDRMRGGAKTLGGRVKEFFGRLFRATRLQTERKIDQGPG